MQGTVWIEPDNTSVYAAHHAQYVEGVLQDVVGVDPVCKEGALF